MADDSQEHAEVENLMRASPDVVLARAESFRDSEDVDQGPGHVGNASDVPVEQVGCSVIPSDSVSIWGKVIKFKIKFNVNISSYAYRAR